MLDTYPFKQPRPGTEEALAQIKTAFDKGKRFVIVRAPTGSGKSGISVAFARKHKAIVLTPTKFLQDQYANTPEFMFEYVIKGKANYMCGLPKFQHCNVEESVCCSDTVAHQFASETPFVQIGSTKGGASKRLKILCSDSMICPYYSKLYRIPSTPGAIINYDLFFKIKRMPNSERGYDLGKNIVFDEAHQLINKASSNFGHTLTNVGAMRLFGNAGKRGVGESLSAWTYRLINVSKERVTAEKDPKEAAKIENYAKRLKFLISLDIFDDKKFYIDDKHVEVEIKPLDFRMLKQHIFDPFEKILLLTATLPANFKQIFGITDEESEVIDIPSVFDKKNRPAIFAKDLPTLNYKTQFTKSSEQIKIIEDILLAHKNDKGIIHCANYKFFEQIRNIFKSNDRFIWIQQDASKEKMIDLHINSKKPTVLVSPALMEGLDLKDDLARFQVLLKIPYPTLDDYTKKMDEIFPGWYQNLTITNIVQAYGRAVRSEIDYANYYILDGAFNIILSKYKALIPPYLLEALQVGRTTDLVKILKKKAETNE
jgi:ATP-dependent DNA helicase DinG